MCRTIAAVHVSWVHAEPAAHDDDESVAGNDAQPAAANANDDDGLATASANAVPVVSGSRGRFRWRSSWNAHGPACWNTCHDGSTTTLADGTRLPAANRLHTTVSIPKSNIFLTSKIRLSKRTI